MPAIPEDILQAVKPICNLESDNTEFDTELSIIINTAISRLYTIGFEPPTGFKFGEDGSKTWVDLLGDYDIELIGSLQDYICYTCRVKFDPPNSSFLLQALKDQIKETLGVVAMMV